MATPDPNLLDHIKDETIWSAAGATIVTLGGAMYGMLKYLYKRDRNSITTLYEWKDKVVDPALRELPEKYVRQGSCDRRHDDLMRSYARQIEETIHIRELLVRHLGMKGSDGP